VDRFRFSGGSRRRHLYSFPTDEQASVWATFRTRGVSPRYRRRQDGQDSWPALRFLIFLALALALFVSFDAIACGYFRLRLHPRRRKRYDGADYGISNS